MVSMLNFEDAIIAYVTERWEQKAKNKVGRTIIQKLCYFLKHEGVPMNYKFKMYHFGPFSQELFFRMEELESDNVIKDELAEPERSAYVLGENAEEAVDNFSESLQKYEQNVNGLIDKLAAFYKRPEELELLATIHYFYSARLKFNKRPPSREDIIEETIEVKNKFTEEQVEKAYDFLESSGLLKKDILEG